MKNNLLEWRSRKASSSYMWSSPSEQHDFATSMIRVLTIIQLKPLFAGKAHLIMFHAAVDHTSSMMTRYLEKLVYGINQL